MKQHGYDLTARQLCAVGVTIKTLACGRIIVVGYQSFLDGK